MRKRRRDVIDPEVPGTYHISCRCVRRAYLFGKDAAKKANFSHREAWIDRRVRELAGWFAIDIFFVSWMANHFHLVLRNRPQLVAKWDDQEVIKRAARIFPYKFGRMGVKEGRPTDEQLAALVANKELVASMRARLADPSWFMRQLNQKIARRANLEDGCTGHFFEARFACQVILDEFGFLVCGIYIDLNPIAAKVATKPENSRGTSAYYRIAGRGARARGSGDASDWDGFLAPLTASGDGQSYPKAGEFGSARASDEGILDTSLEEYLRLLDWTGRQIRPGKRGRISSDLPPILERLGLPTVNKDQENAAQTTAVHFCAIIEQFDELFSSEIGLSQLG